MEENKLINESEIEPVIDSKEFKLMVNALSVIVCIMMVAFKKMKESDNGKES